MISFGVEFFVHRHPFQINEPHWSHHHMSSSDDERDLTQSDPAETLDGSETSDHQSNESDRDIVIGDTVLSDPSKSESESEERLHPGMESSRFRVIRTYAEGGLGRVVLARDIGLGRNVAIKDINPKRDSEQARMRLVREATVTGVLEHPNIIPVYDVGYYDDGSPYYVMRFVQGHTLRDVIIEYHAKAQQNRTARRLEMRRLLRHLIEVCSAVGYAHSQAVLHRDIKPANIMIGKHDETLILDWGLTKTMDEFGEVPDVTASSMDENSEDFDSCTDGSWESGQTRMGSVLGTPGFMSPEQTAGKIAEMTNATDVYGLGATLYYLLCGQRPIVEKSRVRLINRTIAREFEPPVRIKPNVPKPLDSICLKAMATEPNERYETAGELADDIENWLAGERVSAYRESVWQRTERWIKNHRSLAYSALAACLLVGAVALASMTVISNVQEEKRLALQEKALLADIQEYSDSVGRIQTRLASHLAGFAKPCMDDLANAADVDSAIRNDSELRSLAASTLVRTDVVEQSRRPHGVGICGPMAVSSDGKMVAVARGFTGITNTGVKLHRIAGTPDKSSSDSVRTLKIAFSGVTDMVKLGTSQRVTDVCFSADGRYVAAGVRSNEVLVWDLESPSDDPTLRWRVGDKPRTYTFVRFHASGEFLFAASGSSVTKWKFGKEPTLTATWKATTTKDEAGSGPTSIASMNYCESEDVLYVGYLIDRWAYNYQRSRVARLSCDLEDPKPRIIPSFDRPKIAVSDDGELLVVSCAKGSRLELYDGRRMLRLSGYRHMLHPDVDRLHSEKVNNIDIDPTNSHVMIVTEGDQRSQSMLQVYEVATGKRLLTQHLNVGEYGMFSPDGKSIVVLDRDDLVLYSHRTSSVMRSISPHQKIIGGFSFIPKSDFVACLGIDVPIRPITVPIRKLSLIHI